MLDGLVPVDYVRHSSKEPLGGSRLVVQSHLRPNVAEAAVFRKLELNWKFFFHKVLGLWLWKVLWSLKSRG